MLLSFEDKRKQLNKKVVAQYLSLYTENTHLKKAMVTITPSDGKLLTILGMRKKFFKKLGKTKIQKKNQDLSIKYFSVIEWTKTSQPHLHIQLFYTNIEPIKKAFNFVVDSDNTIANKISYNNSKKSNVKFNYVIKDYLYSRFDISREHYKADTIQSYKRQGVSIRYITSSRKQITNDIVRYLLRTLNFTTKDKYQEILNLIDSGKIQINKSIDTPILGNNVIKEYVNIGIYEVIIFY